MNNSKMTYREKEDRFILGLFLFLVSCAGQILAIYGIYDWLTASMGSGIELFLISPLCYICSFTLMAFSIGLFPKRSK